MQKLIHHLLRGFVADVRPHGKPTTKMNIANYNKYNKHTGGEGKNRTSLLSNLYFMTHSPGRCADLHRLRSLRLLL